MARARDNRDGTISIIRDDGTEEKYQKGTGELISDSGSPQAPSRNPRPGRNTGAGATGGGEGESPDAQQGPPTEDEVLQAVRDWLDGDRVNGISPNEGKRILSSIGSNPDLIDDEVGFIGPQRGQPGDSFADTGTNAGAGATGGSEGELPDAQVDTSGYTPFQQFLSERGIDPLNDDIVNAIRPQAQEAFLSSQQAGRGQLFQNFLDQSIPLGSPGIIEDVLSTVFPQANTNFLLNQALREAPEIIASGIEGIGGGFPDINLGSSFSGFLNQPGAFRGFNQDLGQFLDLVGGDLEQLSFNNPQAFNLRQRLVEDPSLAFNFINSQVGGPVFSPFAGAARSARNRIFSQLQNQNPNLTGLDFLNQFHGGGFSGLF